MGGKSVPTTPTQDIKTPASIPGTTDVSRGATTESPLSQALAKNRKKRGFSSTMTPNGGVDLSGSAGKTTLGE